MNALEKHGALRVEGARLVGKDGKAVRLLGVSTHGLAWAPQYVCEETFAFLRDSWKVNCVRLALYTDEYHGFCTDGDKQELTALVKKGIDLAVKLGLYVILDWHVLAEESPLVYADEAERFLGEISRCYAGCPNLLYEICNEPNGSGTWKAITEYANRVIPVIRRNSPEAVVIVGTPQWCQRCDEALEAPLEYGNLLYSVHFYASTHKDSIRNNVRRCLEAGLPVFISECSTTDAFGKGDPDEESSKEWFSLLDEYGVGFICWSLSATPDSSSILKFGCGKLSGWEDADLKQTGLDFRNRFIAASK